MKLRLTQRMLLLVAALLLNPLAIVWAADVTDGNIRYSVPETISLGARGILLPLHCEQPCDPGDQKDKRLNVRYFQVAKPGDNPLKKGGWSGRDLYGGPNDTLRSTESLVSAYLTENDEFIYIYRDVNFKGDVVQIPIRYMAEVPFPWSTGSDRMLLGEGQKPGQKQLEEPVRVEVTGSIAKRDLLLTLRGKDQAYSFTWDANLPIPRWEMQPKAADPPKPPATPTEGDLMRAEFCSQRMVGDNGNARLVTVLVEEPLPDAKGRRKAFYYFVVDSPDDAGDLEYVACRIFTDDKAVGSGPNDKEAASPDAKLIGSISKGSATLAITVRGQTTTHNWAGEWKRE